MLRSLFLATEVLRQRLFFQPQLQWIGAAAASAAPQQPSLLEQGQSALQDALWFAVPKKRVTRHKKRLRNTLKYRIKLRENIVTDPRTGELTLKHRLPYNWYDYLPDPPKVELSVYKKLRRKRYLENENDNTVDKQTERKK